MADQTSTIPKGSDFAKATPDTWKMTTLGEVVDIQSGFAFKSQDFESKKGFPVVKIKNIQPPIVKIERGDLVDISSYGEEKLAKFEVKNGEFLIAMTGETIGKVGKYNLGKFAYINQRVCKIIKTEKSDYGFVYYLLLQRSFQKYIDTHSFGAAQANISTDQIGNYKISLPEPLEQRAIAAVLSSLDDKIELLREQNKTLEATAQAIFKEWFVDFNFPGATGKMIDSELGEIPEGWRVGMLSEIANFLNGLALQNYPPESSTEYLPVIKIKELNSGISEQTDKASARLDKKYIVEDGDVLFSWSGSLIVDIWKYGKGALNQHLFRVTSDEFPKWFYFYWIKEHLPSFQQTATAKAVTMGHIQRHHLDDALITIPDDNFLKVADNIFTPLLKKMINSNSEIQALSALRDALLPKLMSGMIRVNV